MSDNSIIRTELLAQPTLKQTIPNIQTLLLHLKRKGRSKNTIRAYETNLIALAKRANLNNPQEVEDAIADYKIRDMKTKKLTNRPCTNNYKSKLCDCYATYCKMFKIDWEKPTYTPEDKSIQPPTPEKTQMLISAAKGTLSIKIDILYQTGLRPCEIQGEKGLQVKDIHPDQNTITARIHKGCNARPPLKITPELTGRIQQYITTNNLQPDDIIFAGREKGLGESYRKLRNRLAKKLNDPTIRTIRLYDLRHAYCTKQLRRIQNPEIVRQIMGHKKLNTTQKYMHLLAGNSGEWIVEGTTDSKRAKELLADDFTYQLTAPDGTMIFRKSK